MGEFIHVALRIGGVWIAVRFFVPWQGKLKSLTEIIIEANEERQ